MPKPQIPLTEGYGWCDLACPQRVYIPRKGQVWSLGDVWREIRGVANVGIVRLSDDVLIYRRDTKFSYYGGKCVQYRAR